jgi:hypothetical protein
MRQAHGAEECSSCGAMAPDFDVVLDQPGCRVDEHARELAGRRGEDERNELALDCSLHGQRSRRRDFRRRGHAFADNRLRRRLQRRRSCRCRHWASRDRSTSAGIGVRYEIGEERAVHEETAQERGSEHSPLPANDSRAPRRLRRRLRRQLGNLGCAPTLSGLGEANEPRAVLQPRAFTLRELGIDEYELWADGLERQERLDGIRRTRHLRGGQCALRYSASRAKEFVPRADRKNKMPLWTWLSLALGTLLAVPLLVGRVMGLIADEMCVVLEREQSAAAPLTRALDELRVSRGA